MQCYLCSVDIGPHWLLRRLIMGRASHKLFDSCCFLFKDSRGAIHENIEQLTLHLSRHCGVVVSTQYTSDSVLFPLKVFLSYCLFFREAMSSQPPTYNIYFVAGNVSREHFLRPSTPAGRPVLTPGAVNISIPNPAPRRPPLPPGQSGSAFYWIRTSGASSTTCAF